MILQIEWISQLIEAAAAQGFTALILAVMVGLLAMACGAIWRQYTKILDKYLESQNHQDEIVKLMNNKNYDALKELVVRMEAERRFNT